MEDDPTRVHEYLADRRFSRKIKCNRTGLAVSFADFGDPEGCAVIFIPPSACSRWFAVPQDQLCRQRGIRMIVVDRPGCGATPMVPLEQRLEMSSQHILSVLEHLDVKPRHLITTSAGIYYTLHLLLHHSDFFPNVPQPVFISPWVPLSDTTHTVLTQLAFTMIPDIALKTQHVAMPALVKIERAAGTAFNTSTRSLQASSSWTSRLWDSGIRRPSSEGQADSEEELSKKWRDAVSSITTDYLHAEECRGISDEMMLSLNRGSADTGSAWFERTMKAISDRLIAEDREMLFTIWWGHQDPMVPRKAQLWLNGLIEKTPAVKLKVYDVEDADHTDLLWRKEGMPMVFAMFHFRERVYYGG